MIHTRTGFIPFLLFLCALAVCPAAAQKLNLENPDDVVRANRKIYASLEDGKPTVYFWEGKIYGRVQGERDKLLFTYVGMNIRTSKTVSDEKGYGFRMFSRELLLYMDPKTGEVIDTWKNPYTGREVEVVHVSNDPVNHTMRARSSRGDASWGGNHRGNVGWLTIEIPLFYPNPLGGPNQKYVGGYYKAMEMFNFFFPMDQLLDANTSEVTDASISWTRLSQWLPWMEMGSRPGEMIYHGAGKRLSLGEDLPKSLLDRIKSHYPAWREPPPLDDQRRNVTSWSFYKKYLNEKAASDKQEN